jgi:hypothetical protein
MKTLIIQTDTLANARLLLSFLKNVRIVQSVSVKGDIEKEPRVLGVKESKLKYNWTNPSRPATNEEIEQMLDECEKSKEYTVEEARRLTKKKISAWRKKTNCNFPGNC